MRCLFTAKLIGGRGNACSEETSKRRKIFTAVNNFFADSPLVNQLKGIMVSGMVFYGMHNIIRTVLSFVDGQTQGRI